ncbi:MAG: type III glutamate--ammonia ligase, partial [Pseudomonadota bacterium]
KARGAKTLPLNLLDALRALRRDRGLAEALGAETVAAFAKLKQDEWTDYTRHFTEWERATTLDC